MPKAIKVATFLLAVGYSIRCLINQNFYSVLAGQIILGIGLPIVANIQGKFITLWFDEKERGLWIAICTMANPFGSMINFLLPIFMVDQGKNVDPEKHKKQIFWYLVAQAVPAILVFLLTMVLWIKGRSRAEISRLLEEREALGSGALEVGLKEKNKFKGVSLWNQVRHILGRGNITLLIMIYSLGFGVIVAVGSQLVEIFHSVDVKPVNALFANIGSICLGTIGSIVYSKLFLKKSWQLYGMFFSLLGT